MQSIVVSNCAPSVCNIIPLYSFDLDDVSRKRISQE